MMDLRQTPEYANYVKSINWKVERVNGNNYFIKKLPLLGNIIKLQRPNVLKNGDVKKILDKYKPFQFVIEPNIGHPASEFKLSKSPYLPTKTLQIDLTKSNVQLLKNMHQKTRYNIKVATKNGVEISSGTDISQFSDFWHKCQMKRLLFLSQKKEITALYKSFNKNRDILLAKHDGSVVAALLVIGTGKVSYYMYAGSSKLGKDLHAPTLLTWEAISMSKAHGSKVFDFEGLYDDRFPLESWRGFTKFKKGFGGYEVEYPGCYIKKTLPL